MLKKEQKSFDQIIRESIRETLNVNGVQTVDKSLNKIKEESDSDNESDNECDNDNDNDNDNKSKQETDEFTLDD